MIDSSSVMPRTVGADLELKHLVLSLPDRAPLPQIDLHVAPGTSLAVTGPSGSGKTSLLAVLAGLLAPSKGTVELGGRPIEIDDSQHKRRVGYVQQAYGLVAALTAIENVALPLLGTTAPTEAWSRAADALETVGLSAVTDQLVDRMSGGQQQRVAVARALVTRPTLILADEPTSELDPSSRSLILHALFGQCSEHSTTLVIATHDAAVAGRCDRQLSLLPPLPNGRHRRRASSRTMG